MCVYECNSSLAACNDGVDDGYCADLTNDPSNCGACFNQCDASNGTAVCSNSKCSVECPSGTSYCASNDECAETQSDVSQCGTGCVDCMAKATADGIPASSIQSVSCNAGVCQATVVGEADATGTSAGKTCDQICIASLHVACNYTDAPPNCPDGECAFYSGEECADVDYDFGCTVAIPLLDPNGCGGLTNIQCFCSGTGNL
jgi:hypothetical protein